MKGFAAAAVLVSAALAGAREPGAMIEWPYVGRIPLIKPPYAHLVAIDLNEGETAWKVPFREGSPEVRGHPLLPGVELPERLGTRGNSGPTVTKGGLVFVGRRTVPVCVRQRDRRRGLARRDAVSNEREPDDLPRAIGAAVRRHRDRHRIGRRARRLRATEVANRRFQC